MHARTLGTLSFALAMAAPGVAQDSTARAARTPPAASAETVLRLRQELELSGEQVSQLDAVRREALATRQAHMAQMMELRSRQLAGELSLEDWRTEMTKSREDVHERLGAQDGRVAGILTEAQRTQLTELRWQARRQQGWMGRGGRRGGGFGPNMRGPAGPGWGYGPGAGPRWERMPRGRMAPGMGPWGGRRGGWGMRPWGPPPDSAPDSQPDR